MFNRGIAFSRNNLDPRIKDVNNWATVDASFLDEENKKKYENRKGAVAAYLSDSSMADIRKDYGLSRHEIIRLVKRCLNLHKDGKIWGFRALIPYNHQKSYERVADSASKDNFTFGGESGALTKLFEQYPEIKEQVDSLFLKKYRKGLVHESRIPKKAIHKRFLDACRSAGIKSNSYPFSVKQLGEVSLWKYLKKLFDQEQERSTRARYGKEAARILKSEVNNSSDDSAVTRPYQRVEFDAHLIDAFCTITVPSVFGGTVELVLDRIWILVIIEVFTRAILGYHISFNKQYNEDDVLLCVKNAITPWKPKKLTIPSLKYPERGGFPSGVFEELKWALWDELAYDNAKANLSVRVRERLTSVVNCAVNAGPVETPERRPFIERFFGVLEENGYHRLPSTTGSNTKDTRRDNPEGKALEFHISLEHIEELTDVMIAQYNGAPHSGIGYRSPLEFLDYFVSSDNILPRQLPKQEQNNIKLLNVQMTRVVRGGREKGRSPYITFEGVKYRNDILSRSNDLVGAKLTLIIDTSDIRSVTVLLPNGAEFGILTAQGVWGRTPHTLEMRKAILNLKNRRLIHYTESDDPIQIYLDYLGEKSIKNRTARRKFANAKQVQKQKKSKNDGASATVDSLENKQLDKTDAIKNRETGRKRKLSKLKTFTY